MKSFRFVSPLLLSECRSVNVYLIIFYPSDIFLCDAGQVVDAAYGMLALKVYDKQVRWPYAAYGVPPSGFLLVEGLFSRVITGGGIFAVCVFYTPFGTVNAFSFGIAGIQFRHRYYAVCSM